MTSASSSGTGLQLDPNDPNDAKIMRRQQAVARKAGRDGLDRAGATRGRADLEAAYDEGAQQAAAASAPAASPSPATPAKSAATAGAKGGAGGGKSGAGGGPKGGAGGGKPAAAPPSSKGSGSKAFGSFRPSSPAKLPTRAQDAGGFLTGLALYTVVVIYIRYGPAGWKGWLSAKFLNKPLATNADGGTGTKPKTKNGGSAAI